MNSDTENQVGTCRVEVHYKDANKPLVYEAAYMTYMKGPFYVVAAYGREFKHPVRNIWRIIEERNQPKENKS